MAGVVTIGMVADKVDHLTTAIGCLSVIGPRLVHHSAAVPTRHAHRGSRAAVACSRLRETWQREPHGLGGGITRFLVSIFVLGAGQAGSG
jgi:hypothetical protein